jgi:hypothetical protein
VEWAVRRSSQLVEVEDAQARRATVLRMTGMPSAVSSARAWAWRAGRGPSVSASRASISASSWASMALSTPRVTVSHHGPASATLAGERLSWSRATARRACSIKAGGHPLVTTASLMTTARHRAVHRAVGLPRTWRAVMHCRASWSRSVMPQASSRSWSASSAGAGADRPRREGVGGGGVSVRISGLGRSSAATLAADVRPGFAGTASGSRSRSRSEAGGSTGGTRRRRRLRRSPILGRSRTAVPRRRGCRGRVAWCAAVGLLGSR